MFNTRMSLLLVLTSLAVIGILSFNSFYVQPAYALDAVTFTSHGTINSASTSQFQRVWDDEANDQIIAVDGNTNGTYTQTVHDMMTHTNTVTTSDRPTSTTVVLSPPTATSASSTDATGFTWYSVAGSCGTTSSSCEMYDSGSRQGTAEKIVNTASSLYNKPVNTMTVEDCYEGSFYHGTAYYGVIDGSNPSTMIKTFGTKFTGWSNCSTGTWASRTFSLTNDASVLTTGQKIGVVYQSGSSATISENLHVNRKLSSSAIDGTNSVESIAVSTHTAWSDQVGDAAMTFGYLPYTAAVGDNSNVTFWRNNVNSEAGAYICAQEGATVGRLTNGVRVYFPDATEIPQVLDVLTSTTSCTAGLTDQGDWTTTNAAGWQSFNFTDTTSKFLVLKVNTWGSDVRFRVGEIQVINEPSVNTLPRVSYIEANGTMFVTGLDSAMSTLGITKFDLSDNSQDDDYFVTSTKTPKDIAQTNSTVWIALIDTSNNLYLGKIDRGLTTYVEVSLGDNILANGFVHIVAYDGSPNTIYVVYTDTATVLKVAKYTSSASILSTGMTQASNADFSVVQINGKVLIGTNSKFYELNTSTDAITQVYSAGFKTFFPQPFNMTGGNKNYSTDPIYGADATYATQYIPTTGVASQAAIIVNSVNNSTGIMNVYAPAKYYMLTGASHVLEGATTTATAWTVKELGSQTVITPNPYQETLNVALARDRTVLTQDVLFLACDTNYHINSYAFEKFSVGDDSDCTSWTVVSSAGATVGRRILDYTTTPDLVHANAFTGYTVRLIDGSSYEDYRVNSYYDSKIVDQVDEDASGEGQQRYLYGQCYLAHIIHTPDSTDVMTVEICANDNSVKTISLGGGGGGVVEGNSTGFGYSAPITLPTKYSGGLWSHVGERVSSSGAFFYEVKNLRGATPIRVNVTLTNPDGTSNTVPHILTTPDTIAVFGIQDNQTISTVGYDNSGNVIFADSFAASLANLEGLASAFAPFSIMGLPVGAVSLVALGTLFTRSTSHIGIVIVLAAAGIMVGWGILSHDIMNTTIWGILLVFGALGILWVKNKW